MDCPDAIMDLEDVSSENRGSEDEDDDKRELGQSLICSM